MLRQFVCVDSETLEVRRYEQSDHGGRRTLKMTHAAGFVPTGDRAREREVIERFRKFPSDVLLHDDRPRFDPIPGISTDLERALAQRPGPYIS